MSWKASAIPAVDAESRNDSISGDGGSTTIYGGTGNDVIYSSNGRVGSDWAHSDTTVHSLLEGGSGNTHLYGSAGSDTLTGGSGNDSLFAGAGTEYLVAGSGNNVLVGGEGNDTLIGGSGNDSLFASDGTAYLAAGSGDNVLVGGAGSDTLIAGNGNTTIYGRSPRAAATIRSSPAAVPMSSSGVPEPLRTRSARQRHHGDLVQHLIRSDRRCAVGDRCSCTYWARHQIRASEPRRAPSCNYPELAMVMQVIDSKGVDALVY